MKILNIVSSIDPSLGGVSQAVLTLHKGFNANGADSYILNLDLDGDYKLENFVKEKTIFLGPRKTPWQYSKKLRTWLDIHLKDFDIIIIHGLWLYHEYAVFKSWKARRKKNTPKNKLYVMPHGMLDEYFQNNGRAKAIRNNMYWRLIERKILNTVDGIIFTTEDEKKHSLHSFPAFHPLKTMVLSLGVEGVPHFGLERENLIKAACKGIEWKNYILFLGRIHSKKGVDILVNAYKKIATKEVNLPQLLIAGPGFQEPFGKNILNMINEDKNIFHLDMLFGDLKWQAFYGAKAFILPSHQENFGITVVEALSCKLPVLISNKVNIYREIETNHAGIVKSDTVEGTIALLESISQLSNMDLDRMSDHAYALFQNEYDYKKTALRFLECLSKSDT